MEVYEYFQPPSVIENSPVQLTVANSHMLHNNNYNRAGKFLTAQ